MKRFRCTVAYVGAAYNGWQSQANGNGVQDIIEEAIFRVAKERISVKASGRTDAGVSAKGQVFHFDTEKELTARKWMGAINCFLPKDRVSLLRYELSEGLAVTLWGRDAAAMATMRAASAQATVTAVGCPAAVSSAKLGPLSTA